jgi:hypothetical protein
LPRACASFMTRNSCSPSLLAWSVVFLLLHYILQTVYVTRGAACPPERPSASLCRSQYTVVHSKEIRPPRERMG